MVGFEHQKHLEITGITEPEDGEGSDNNKSINIITDIKLLTDKRNHITMTKNYRFRKWNYRGYRITATTVPPDKRTRRPASTGIIWQE